MTATRVAVEKVKLEVSEFEAGADSARPMTSGL